MNCLLLPSFFVLGPCMSRWGREGELVALGLAAVYNCSNSLSYSLT